MTEGTIAFVFVPHHSLEGRSRHSDPELIYRARPDGMDVQVIGMPDGGIQVLVDHETLGRIGYFHSQPISFTYHGPVHFMATWSPQEVCLYLNGEPIQSSESTTESALVEGSSSELEPRAVSLDHVDARAACATWIDWRRQRYGNPTPPKVSRRSKTDLEQLQELRDAVHTIGQALTAFRQGNVAMTGIIATLVRSLLYWQDRPGSQYNPLLLRLAGRIDLALPIYAFPDQPFPSGVPTPEIHIKSGLPGIVDVSPSQRLMDVQEWLTSIVVTQQGASPRSKMVKDVLSEIANTGGASHFDEDMPEVLDRLRAFWGGELDQLSALVAEAGNVTVALGIFTLEQLDKAAYGR